MTAAGAGGVGSGATGTGAGAAPGAGGEGAVATPGAGEGQSDFIDLNGLDIPQELHGHMRSYIQSKVDPAVTQKFQELADLRKPYEQFGEIDGLSDVPAEELSALLELRERTGTPEGFTEWFTEIATESLEQNPEGFENWWKQIGEKLGYEFDGDGEPGGGPEFTEGETTTGMTREEFEAAWAEKEAERDQTETTRREEEERVAQARQQVDQHLSEFANGLPDDMSEDDKAQAVSDVLGLALRYSEEAADQQVPKAIADYNRLKGLGETEAFGRKLRQPEPALNGGATRASEDGPLNFDDATRVATERLRARP